MIFCLWYLSAHFNRVWACTLFNSFSWIFPYAKQQHNFQRKPIETNCFLYTSDDYQCKIDEPEERKIGKFVTGSSFLIRSVKYQYVLDGDNISVATNHFIILIRSTYICIYFNLIYSCKIPFRCENKPINYKIQGSWNKKESACK